MRLKTRLPIPKRSPPFQVFQLLCILSDLYLPSGTLGARQTRFDPGCHLLNLFKGKSEYNTCLSRSLSLSMFCLSARLRQPEEVKMPADPRSRPCAGFAAFPYHKSTILDSSLIHVTPSNTALATSLPSLQDSRFWTLANQQLIEFRMRPQARSQAPRCPELGVRV